MSKKEKGPQQKQGSSSSAKRGADKTPAMFVSPKRNKARQDTVDNRDSITLRIMGKIDKDGRMEEGVGNIAVAFMDNGRKKGDDGFWPFTTGLAKDGDGIYKAENRKTGKVKTISMRNLLDIYVVNSGYRRESLHNNVILRNVSVDEKNNKQWGRKYLLIVAGQPMDTDLWTTELAKILQVRNTARFFFCIFFFFGLLVILYTSPLNNARNCFFPFRRRPH